jgi:recombination protein RecT
MNQVAVSPAKRLNDFMEQYKGQIALALPKHITADRMVRLTMTSFSQNAALQKCDMHSIFASVVIAAQLGLEIGVGGQGYLVPYKGKATFVPGKAWSIWYPAPAVPLSGPALSTAAISLTGRWAITRS